MSKQEEASTESTTGKMPWDDLFDCTYYTKTQVKIETVVYEIKVIREELCYRHQGGQLEKEEQDKILRRIFKHE